MQKLFAAFLWNIFVSAHEWKFLTKEPSQTLYDYVNREPNDGYDIVYNLISRVLGTNEYNDYIGLEFIKNNGSNPDLDIIELDNNGTHVILRGTSIVALTKGFGVYLEEYCNTTYDFEIYQVQIPDVMPLPKYQRLVRSVPMMYYQNVCTVSYTMAFWDWNLWEKNLDWAAMQGITHPLAFNGQEYVFAKMFHYFGFTTADLETFFSGPGFYAWQRMGNIQGWGGPLKESEIINQYNLQIKILARMYSFGMKPVLTCFAGHVPMQINTLYPRANITHSAQWNGFPYPYGSVTLLNFEDPLFRKFGSKFIELQIKYYNTSHYYQCDTFNEMIPSSNDTEYLTNASQYVYQPMKDADNNAIWVIQSWVFNNHNFWNNITVKAYLNGVNNNDMLILDLDTEHSPLYNKYDSYYGKPFIFNTLHDFGGHHGMMARLDDINNGFINALNYDNTTIVGVGITPEGIWQNYIVYDFTYKLGYTTKKLNISQFGDKYAYRRYGLPFSAQSHKEEVAQLLTDAWSNLVDTVYEYTDPVQASIIVHVPHFQNASKNNYNITWIQRSWKYFVSIGHTLSDLNVFNYDLVDITRQAMSDLFGVYYHEFNECYYDKNISCVEGTGDIMLELIDDMDLILLTNKYWMLYYWIEMARNSSNITDTQNWYEFNARNQITMWGPNGEINNYASKQWADLVGQYYRPQWEIFFSDVLEAMIEGKPFNATKFNENIYQDIELPFQSDIGGYHEYPVGNAVDTACYLYVKYNIFGDTHCVDL